MILFVDDEKRRMSSYVEELEMSDHKVHFESDINDAFEFFKEHQSQISLLILDIMMPPGDGEAFSEARTEYGLMTGIAFYKKVSSYQPDIPTIIFTNVSKESLSDISKESLNKEIDSKDKVIICEKNNCLPFELEEKVKALLQNT